MISRRLLRIKVLHILYAYFKTDDPSINKFEKELFHSIEKTYELYFYFLLLSTELQKLEDDRITLGKNKRIPTEEDLNPNTKFLNNRVINQINVNSQLLRYINEKGVGWANNPEFVKKLYKLITSNQYFHLYMESEQDSYEWDKKVLVKIYSEDILNHEPLYQLLEEESIYWNDDVDFVISMIIKTLKGFRASDNEDARLMPMFKNEEDRDFVKNLYRKAILKSDDNLKLISEYTKNWDVDRIAFMDILLMQTALAEITEFPSIPVKVTLNEYIEISKFYSTNKSSTFINGILDKIVNKLRRENKIQKQGRGLIGEFNQKT